MIAATKQGSGVIEEFSYDPWGRRRNPNDWNDYDVTEPTLFTRGYTGHEHIGAYSLINMNGRMYDPRLGRFMSPDPYVQAPGYTQSFNRYSYVWNNPLKYTDPSGEIVLTILAAIFAPPLLPLAIAADMGGIMNMALNSSSIDNGWKALGYYGIGAAAGAIGAGVGMGVSATLAGGSFWAGVAGTSLHVSTGFAAGFVSGAAGGFSGGFVSGFGNAAMNRDNNLADMFLSGLDYGWKGAIFGGIAGGIYGGIDAINHDRNFWTGAEKQHGYVRVNPDGSSGFTSYGDVRSEQTQANYRTYLDNNKGVSIDNNGWISIKHDRSINRINAMTNPEGFFLDPLAKKPIITRGGLSFKPFSNPPDWIFLHGYRYHSNPITSIRHLFYFRLR